MKAAGQKLKKLKAGPVYGFKLKQLNAGVAKDPTLTSSACTTTTTSGILN